ncbi:MAG: hypothetical protein ACREPL_00450 [Rhodanobacteraceae bacterium]
MRAFKCGRAIGDTLLQRFVELFQRFHEGSALGDVRGDPHEARSAIRSLGTLGAQFGPMHFPIRPEHPQRQYTVLLVIALAKEYAAGALGIRGVDLRHELFEWEIGPFGTSENDLAFLGCRERVRGQVQLPGAQPSRLQGRAQPPFTFVQLQHPKTDFALAAPGLERCAHDAGEDGPAEGPFQERCIAQRLGNPGQPGLLLRAPALPRHHDERQIRPACLVAHPFGERAQVRGAQRFVGHHGQIHFVG